MPPSDHDIQRRAHFRLRYPMPARPVLRAGNEIYYVNEISEGGMRLVLHSDNPQSAAPEQLSGELTLAGERLSIDAQLLRREGREVIMRLAKGIPLSLVLSEQRRLLKAYPRMFGRDE